MSVNIYFINLTLLLLIQLVNSAVPIVSTNHGKVSGKLMKTLLKEQNILAFLGIPYAKPPVKTLRFLPPQPIDNWDETLIARKSKKACIQFNNNIKKQQPLGVYGAEDCLYLDIYTPNLDDKKRPIIVFLQNHNFNYANNKTDYGPDFFIEEDIIVVYINHRLSIFGFLSLEDDVVPGNAGLKDIIVAVEWVKENAKQFGGDPNKITLMGSEDGATAIDFLVHSNKHHLINSVILQSGSSLNSMFLQRDSRQRAYQLAELLNKPCSNNYDLLNTLNDLSPVEMLPLIPQTAPADYLKENQRSMLPFGPVVETDPLGIITGYPENFEGKLSIPVLTGFNSLEGLEAALHYLLEPRYMNFVKKDFPLFMPVRVGFKFEPHDKDYEQVLEALTQFYFNGQIGITSVAKHVSYLSDVLRSFSVDALTQHYSEISSKNVYYYHFDYDSDLNDNKRDIIGLAKVDDYVGAASGDELCYLFRCPGLKDQYLNHDRSMSPAIIMQRKLVRLWANFVKFGNPIQDGDDVLEDLQWPPYTTESKQYLHIGNTLQVRQELYKERFDFWESLLKKYKHKIAVNTSREEL